MASDPPCSRSQSPLSDGLPRPCFDAHALNAKVDRLESELSQISHLLTQVLNNQAAHLSGQATDPLGQAAIAIPEHSGSAQAAITGTFRCQRRTNQEEDPAH